MRGLSRRGALSFLAAGAVSAASLVHQPALAVADSQMAEGMAAAEAAEAVHAVETAEHINSVAAAPEAAGVNGSIADLQGDAASWKIYVDPPERRAGWRMDNVAGQRPQNRALRVGIGGGDPYTGIHAYRNNFPAAPDATSFKVSMDFRFDHTTWNNEGGPSRIQALEFTMNQFVKGRRWEWALQWENVDHLGRAGFAPTWRLWDGHNWQDINVAQRLTPDAWHHLTLEGEIRDGKAYYTRFSCDDVSSKIDQSFASTYMEGADGMAVAVQLNGNGKMESYDMVIDRHLFEWSAPNGRGGASA
jgi:hypothetical protein